MDETINSRSTDATAWHALSVNEVLKRFGTSIGEGLDAGEASTRLQNYRYRWRRPI
jgi:Cation transporter/ATPase, N-terminus